MKDKWNVTNLIKPMATPAFKASITEDDISLALPKNSGHCMIADAVKRCFSKKFKRTAYAVTVDLQTIRVSDKAEGMRYIYFTPRLAQINLIRFDRGQAVTPFELRLKGGQVVPVRARQRVPRKPETVKKHNLKVYAIRKAKRANKRARLHIKQRGFFAPVVTKVGGKTPPVALLTGRRREFGINLSEKELQALTTK